jgi:hypothetical protein
LAARRHAAIALQNVHGVPFARATHHERIAGGIRQDDGSIVPPAPPW